MSETINRAGNKTSNAVICSFVHHNNKCWKVSTIYRQCSSRYNDSWYYETIIFEFHMDIGCAGKIVHQGEGLYFHFDACKKILDGGAFWESENV